MVVSLLGEKRGGITMNDIIKKLMDEMGEQDLEKYKAEIKELEVEFGEQMKIALMGTALLFAAGADAQETLEGLFVAGLYTYKHRVHLHELYANSKNNNLVA